jgi:hypothetical protein
MLIAVSGEAGRDELPITLSYVAAKLCYFEGPYSEGAP